MPQFPVPLDSLITYVKALHPEGDALENVSDAFTVSEQLNDHADALIGYYVDRARRSGASWSQIGAAMGVTKQAAQKRFVPAKLPGPTPQGQDFSRFTLRSRNVLGAAGRLAAANGTEVVSAACIAAGLMTEPAGLAAVIIAKAGITPDQFHSAVGAGPADPAEDVAGPDRVLGLMWTDDAKATLAGALKAALRLGHNYIGTEHLLLGLLSSPEQIPRIPQMLSGLGLTQQRAEELLEAEIERIQVARGKA